MPNLTVGVPSEIKDNENRVAMQPDGVAELVHAGNPVLVQAGAGAGLPVHRRRVAAAGASIVPSADEVFAGADLIVKVEDAVPGRNTTGSARTATCAPICTWPPTSNSPISFSTSTSTPSPTKPCKPLTGGYRCSPR